MTCAFGNRKVTNRYLREMWTDVPTISTLHICVRTWSHDMGVFCRHIYDAVLNFQIVISLGFSSPVVGWLTVLEWLSRMQNVWHCDHRGCSLLYDIHVHALRLWSYWFGTVNGKGYRRTWCLHAASIDVYCVAGGYMFRGFRPYAVTCGRSKSHVFLVMICLTVRWWVSSWTSAPKELLPYWILTELHKRQGGTHCYPAGGMFRQGLWLETIKFDGLYCEGFASLFVCISCVEYRCCVSKHTLDWIATVTAN
jgi:hypothetical protein